MSGETTLLPCPICGKKVSIARTENEVGERWWFITRGTYRTTRCNCRLFLESEKFTCGWNDDYSLECRAKLIDKWNTRTHGTLTAEQVREAIESNSWAETSSIREFNDSSWQAIADELNATLGSGTCENISDPPSGFLCSECGWGDFAEPSHLLTTAKFTDNDKGPNHCPNCGRKVVER